MAGKISYEIHIRDSEFNVKKNIATKIRKRRPERKETEEFLKVNVHNMGQYCYLTYINAAILKFQKKLSAN